MPQCTPTQHNNKKNNQNFLLEAFYWSGGMAQMVENLLSKLKAMNSNPSTTKTKQKTQ
jgi:hypothetical protein